MIKKVLAFILLAIIIIALMIAIIVKNNNTQESTNTIQNNIINNFENNEVIKVDTMQIKVNNQILEVKLENNSSVDALIEKLKEEDIVVNAHDYGGFEKVGDLGFNLPTNDTKITTQSGDLILYQGNQLTLYYDTNTWTFTKLGKVEGVSEQELKDILGSGNVTLTISLK